MSGRDDDEEKFDERMSGIEIDVDALEMMELKLLSDVQHGRNPGPISSVLKLRGTEIYQDITRLGVDILGPHALVWEPRRPLYDFNDPSILPDNELALLAGASRRPRANHLRRLKRNPARDHRQADAGAVGGVG